MTRIHNQGTRAAQQARGEGHERERSGRAHRGPHPSFADRLRERRGEPREGTRTGGTPRGDGAHEAQTTAGIDERNDRGREATQRTALDEGAAAASRGHEDAGEQDLRDAHHETTAHVEAMHEARAAHHVEVSAGEEVAEGLRANLDAVVDAMVEACHMGQDAEGRKVIVLELMVPGRGRLLARLRRTRQGVRVQLRAEDKGFARELNQARGELLEGARSRGAKLLSVDVA
ncbi:MAG: hypothetical protein AAGI01_17150 [Myxococcota bacterium]